jgi:hypothetical protein
VREPGPLRAGVRAAHHVLLQNTERTRVTSMTGTRATHPGACGRTTRLLE